MKTARYTYSVCPFVRKDLHKTPENIYYVLQKTLNDPRNYTTFFLNSESQVCEFSTSSNTHNLLWINSHASPSGCSFILYLIQSNSRQWPEGVDLLSPQFSASSFVLNSAVVQLYSDSHQLADPRENSQVFVSWLSLQAGKIYHDKSNSEKEAEEAQKNWWENERALASFCDTC